MYTRYYFNSKTEFDKYSNEIKREAIVLIKDETDDHQFEIKPYLYKNKKLESCSETGLFNVVEDEPKLIANRDKNCSINSFNNLDDNLQEKLNKVNKLFYQDVELCLEKNGEIKFNCNSLIPEESLLDANDIHPGFVQFFKDKYESQKNYHLLLMNLLKDISDNKDNIAKAAIIKRKLAEPDQTDNDKKEITITEMRRRLQYIKLPECRPFYDALKEMKEADASIIIRVEAVASNPFCSNLEKLAVDYFDSDKSLEDYEKLKNGCLENVKEWRNKNKKYPDAAKIAKNILLAIAGLGIVYGIACLINKAVTGHYTFFKSSVNRAANNIEKEVKSIGSIDHKWNEQWESIKSNPKLDPKRDQAIKVQALLAKCDYSFVDTYSENIQDGHNFQYRGNLLKDDPSATPAYLLAKLKKQFADKNKTMDTQGELMKLIKVIEFHTHINYASLDTNNIEQYKEEEQKQETQNIPRNAV